MLYICNSEDKRKRKFFVKLKKGQDYGSPEGPGRISFSFSAAPFSRFYFLFFPCVKQRRIMKPILFSEVKIFFSCVERSKKNIFMCEIVFFTWNKEKKMSGLRKPWGAREYFVFFWCSFYEVLTSFVFHVWNRLKTPEKTFLTWKKEHQKNTKILPGPSGRSNNECEFLFFMCWVERHSPRPLRASVQDRYRLCMYVMFL